MPACLVDIKWPRTCDAYTSAAFRGLASPKCNAVSLKSQQQLLDRRTRVNCLVACYTLLSLALVVGIYHFINKRKSRFSCLTMCPEFFSRLPLFPRLIYYVAQNTTSTMCNQRAINDSHCIETLNISLDAKLEKFFSLADGRRRRRMASERKNFYYSS